jgi:pilus assembly protein CpaB
VNTEGATKTTLLDAKVAPAPKPAAKRVAVIRMPSGEQVEVIKGLDRSTQQF